MASGTRASGGIAHAGTLTDRTSPDEAALARSTLRRASVHLLPYLFVLYVFNFLDRTNVGVAALQMNRDLAFSSEAYGLGAGVFFISYAIFEVPSNLILARVGARRWIARIMVSWGLVAAAMMFVRTPMQFYAMRFLLGIAEAGFFPGIVYYLSEWFPAAQRARAISRFMIALPLSGAIGNPVGVWLLQLDGRMGLAGWQWLFLLEGLPSVLLGISVLRLLPDGPRDARWLPPDERAWLLARLERDREESPAPAHHSALRALAHPMVWMVSLLYFLVVATAYVFTFWAPILVREVLGSSDTMTGAVIGLIACVAAVVMLANSAHSDHTRERPLHAAMGALVAAVGCAGVAFGTTPAWQVLALALVTLGVNAFLVPFWCLPSLLFRGTAAAAGIALVNSLGNLGGFVGPAMFGRLRGVTGGETGAFLGFAVTSLVAVGICLWLRTHPLLGSARRE